MSNSKDVREAKEIAEKLFHDWAKLPDYENLDEDMAVNLIGRIRDVIAKERREIRGLRLLLEVKTEILIAYRTGGSPKDSTWKKRELALKVLEGYEQVPT